VGSSRPGGRLSLTSFFSHLADTLAAQLDAGLAGEDGGKFLTTPLGMARAVLERVVVDEAIAVVRQLAGRFGRATRAGAIGEALSPLVGKARDPFAQRGIGKVQCIRDRLETLAFDDFTHGLGTAKDPRPLSSVSRRYLR
jgi:hypothetical protein